MTPPKTLVFRYSSMRQKNPINSLLESDHLWSHRQGRSMWLTFKHQPSLDGRTGKGEANPLDSVLFFAKGHAHQARRLTVCSSIDAEMPRRFQDVAVRVFCCRRVAPRHHCHVTPHH